MLGICNGFQALIKLGLVPYGEIRPMDDQCPTLTYNLIGRHQSRYVTTRVASVRSPWMLKSQVGDLHAIPISHGEGRFVASDEMVRRLIQNGQVATQYVDGAGVPSWTSTSTPTAPSCPSRASSPRTAGCSARWGTRSGTATLWAGTFPEISTSRCSSPVRNISSKHIFQGPGMAHRISGLFDKLKNSRTGYRAGIFMSTQAGWSSLFR